MNPPHQLSPPPSGITSVHIAGKDAMDLIHRISTIGLTNPSPMATEDPFSSLPFLIKPGLILNPTGKILASFFYARVSNEGVFVTSESLKEFLQQLEHYTFSEKYTVTPSSLNQEQNQEILQQVAPHEDTRIQNLIPRYGYEFYHDGMTNPLDVGFQSAIQDQKGCYPGQEVIEKMIAIGSSAKKLARVRLPVGSLQPLTPQAPLTDAQGKTLGTLTSLGTDPHSALAIVSKVALKTPLFFKTQPVAIEAHSP